MLFLSKLLKIKFLDKIYKFKTSSSRLGNFYFNILNAKF